MIKNIKSQIHKIIDKGLSCVLNTIFNLIWKIHQKISKWMCPHNYRWHYDSFGCVKCGSYCEDHNIYHAYGCTVCEILEFNQREFPHEVLEVNLCRVQNGFPHTEEQFQQEEEFYQMNKNKYFA